MTTLDLLNKLNTVAVSNLQALAGFEWNNVYECLMAEFNCLREYYPDNRYEELSGLVSSICLDAAAAVSRSDRNALLCALSELKGMISALPPDAEQNPTLLDAAFEHAALTHYRNDTGIVIGDSHVNFFSGNETLNYHSIGHGISLCPCINDLNLTVLYLGPCLAYTCLKPGSKAGFSVKLDYLKHCFFRPHARIILSLGEIDLRLHVLKQAEQQNCSVDEIIDGILNNYRQLILSLGSEGYEVCCWGPIASQKDSFPVDPAFPRYGSEQARNRATAVFNQKLRSVCDETGSAFLSIFEKLADAEMMTKAEYLSEDHFHLSQRAMPLALPLLKKAGIR
ncbi:MAG: hypothetical protein IK115_13075 [Lachnospiraceae bacterium]|nr:hypothetical protein [Lachnospiraceae bacterium]